MTNNKKLSSVEKMAIAETDISSLIANYTHLLKVGEEVSVGLCPFHEDYGLSLSVYSSERRQHYYCSQCLSSGNAVRFIQKTENCHYREALRKLVTLYSMKYHGATYDELVKEFGG
jgi:DNA primase